MSSGQNWASFNTVCFLQLIEVLNPLRLVVRFVRCMEKEQCLKALPVVGFQVSKMGIWSQGWITQWLPNWVPWILAIEEKWFTTFHLVFLSQSISSANSLNISYGFPWRSQFNRSSSNSDGQPLCDPSLRSNSHFWQPRVGMALRHCSFSIQSTNLTGTSIKCKK